MRNDTGEMIAASAEAHVGYKALPLRHSVFGPAGRDWNGGFVRAVFQTAGEYLPTDSTVELLALLLADNRVVVNPRKGDLVFYRFPAEEGEPTGQPHVGVVVDAREWKKSRSFVAVEGQTANPAPKSDKTPNGVYSRNRYHTDVLAFARPIFRVPGEIAPSGKPQISVSMIEVGKTNKAVEYVQRGLGVTVGLRDATRGVYDSRTRSAMAEYQRRLGRVGQAANGVPDEQTLRALSRETGEFNVKG